MKTSLSTLLFALTFLPLAMPHASAQEFGDGRGGVIAQFAKTGLKVGDPLPAVDMLDDEGKPFNTRRLTGQYTVLVSGCLT